MVAATLGEQKRAKIKFFAVYIVSVVLIIIILYSLWKTEASASVLDNSPVSLPTNNETLVREDALLHSKLEALDSKYSLALSGGKMGVEAQRAGWQAAESDFKNSLDSIEKAAIAVQDVQQKIALINMVTGFRKSFNSRRELVSSYTTLLSDTIKKTSSVVASTPVTNNEELQELKAILVQKEERVAALEKKRADDLVAKDKIISSLQTQVAQKPNVPVQTITSGGDGEWRQKYTKLKTSYDNVAGQVNTLNRSYKAIVDDNRRLLSQLQAARKQ